ncbi:DNA polymerase subunit Cdc27 [Nemania sp. FL0916]|nr:DNA polymerase subunit Cdc27 [Nemania sp. FL0916]
MEDYKQYLAQKILTEDQVVTYRLLSRALKVHVNTAKEMLYEFHKWQNDKRPDTLHATYIVYGTKGRSIQQDGDIEMTGSQESQDMDAPFSDLVPTYTLSLVAQEQLEESLSQYADVSSIHIYSLAPHPLKDLQLLADAARQVLKLSAADDTPDACKAYGAIANPNVRRRERRVGKIPAASAPPPKIESKPVIKQEAKPSTTTTIKEESKPNAKPAPAKKPAPTGSLKRQGSSGIGQMFAKAAAKPKKTVSKAAASPVASGAMSDDGEDDTEPMVGVKHEDNNNASSSARQARKDRQDELRRMMEESDDGEEVENSPDEEEDEDPMDEEPPPPEPEPEPEQKVEEPAEEEVVASTGGRRRGRRRVTRKKQVKDEDGYLVTIKEQGWESFSEDEAPPVSVPKKKEVQKETATAAGVKSESAAPAPAGKVKKGAAAKGAQGNIMSFFSKK